MVNYQIISPPTGYGWSTPTAVNSHAIVVGRLNAIPNHLTRPVGFIFSQGELTVVEDAAFMAINDNNVIVGYIAQYRNWHRGLPNWTAATFNIEGKRRSLRLPGFSRCTGISSSDIIVGETTITSTGASPVRRSFFAHGDKVSYLPTPSDCVGSSPEFVDDRGNIAGYVIVKTQNRGLHRVPALWIDGMCRTMPIPAGFTSAEIRGLNSSGDYICECNHHWFFQGSDASRPINFRSETYCVRRGSKDPVPFSIHGSNWLSISGVAAAGPAVGSYVLEKTAYRPWYASAIIGPPQDASAFFPDNWSGISLKGVSENGIVVGTAQIDGALKGFMLQLLA